MSEANETVSRRRFALSAAAAAVLPLATRATAPAADDVANESPDKTPADDDRPADDEKPVALRPPHELLVDLLRQKFPHEKLTPDVIDMLRADVAGDLGRSFALDQYPLHNSDEPAFVFAAWRREG